MSVRQSAEFTCFCFHSANPTCGLNNLDLVTEPSFGFLPQQKGTSHSYRVGFNEIRLHHFHCLRYKEALLAIIIVTINSIFGNTKRGLTDKMTLSRFEQ